METIPFKGNTPALILAVLKDMPLHGYGIAREIERRSSKALTFKEGTLYPTLHMLEQEGLVQSEWHRETGGREKKVYTITPAGLMELERQTSNWIAFAAAIGRVLEGEVNAGTSTAVTSELSPTTA